MRPANTTIISVAIVLLAALGGALFGGCGGASPEEDPHASDPGVVVEHIATISGRHYNRVCDPESRVLCYASSAAIHCLPLDQTDLESCPVEETP